MAQDSHSAKKMAERLASITALAFALSLFLFLCWKISALGALDGGNRFIGTLLILSIIVCVGTFIFSKVLEGQSKTLHKEEQAHAAREAQALATNQDRENVLMRLSNVHGSAVVLMQSIPALVQATSSNLDLAEQEYQRGEYSPFWAAIEAATKRLGELSNTLEQFGRLTYDHKELDSTLRSHHQHQPPSFPVRIHEIYTAEQGQLLSQRMDALVGRAQTNYQFATIYEQRRTISVLIAGFTDLGQAISGMTSRITSDLESVVHSIDSASVSSSTRSAEANAMLDNIQRRRLPISQYRTPDY